MNGLGMATVKVPREQLLDRVTLNRERHREIFEQAIEGYRERVIRELERMIEQAKGPLPKIRQDVGLVEPQDHTHDYDLVIDMLKMSVDPEIELTQNEFAQYVRDDWGWKGAFIASTVGAGYTQARAYPAP